MQSLKKIHAWAQMQVPLYMIQIDTRCKNFRDNNMSKFLWKFASKYMTALDQHEEYPYFPKIVDHVAYITMWLL